MLRKLLIVLLLCTLLFETGCWNRRELNDLSIALGMGIDKQGRKYKVTVQVVVPGEIAAKKGRGISPVVIFTAVGDTVFEALRKMTTISPRKIYIAHLRVVVLGEALAREGIGNTLDFLTRDSEARSDFYVAVAKDATAEDVLKILTSLEGIPANKLFNALETSSKRWAPTTAVNLDKLISDLASEGQNPVLTGITITGDPKKGAAKKNVETSDPPTRNQYTTLAVFRKDKLLGWLDVNDSKGYNYIRDDVTSTASVIPCSKGGKLTVEMIRSKTKVKGSIKRGKPHIDINIRGEMNVDDVACHIDLTQKKTIAELEKAEEKLIKQLVEDAIKTAQTKYKVDIFGFGEAIRRSNPKAWKKLKKDWGRQFQNLAVDVKVETNIRQIGAVSNSILETMEE
ncbi:Ger(x)C family spore germination protein [Paenibacillus sp.]|jgi:spore germination protein KC|uniref:Ger(x)C family spore germination protein n=1 Tax=Paenibacillus sp. TaxID=58172 RepID=UPI00282AC3C8|nr:Ger(x)C family spore germination protein [Paenibacillus sp.]MDR0267140.1 Ger(x)C family spore germination protein [Paenibacillus sp.]